MKKKPTMDDLKKAIINVLRDYDSETKSMGNITLKSLQNLQAEYNIYFVEPEEKQVDIL